MGLGSVAPRKGEKLPGRSMLKLANVASGCSVSSMEIPWPLHRPPNPPSQRWSRWMENVWWAATLSTKKGTWKESPGQTLASPLYLLPGQSFALDDLHLQTMSVQTMLSLHSTRQISSWQRIAPGPSSKHRSQGRPTRSPPRRAQLRRSQTSSNSHVTNSRTCC